MRIKDIQAEAEEYGSLYAILLDRGSNRTPEIRRSNMRVTIDCLRKARDNGGMAKISMSGGTFSIEIGTGHHISGYDHKLVLAAYWIGLPVMDFHAMDDAPSAQRAAIVSQVIRGPLQVFDDEQGAMRLKYGQLGTGPLDYIMPEEYIESFERLGVPIHRREV